MNLDALAVQERITAYLCGGGLFNPELANHDAVRDLLIDARAALADAERMGMERAAKILDDIASGWGTRNEYGVLKDAATEIRAEMEPRFPNVYCSQCGRDFGPGDNGFSHCRNHAGKAPK